MKSTKGLRRFFYSFLLVGIVCLGVLFRGQANSSTGSIVNLTILETTDIHTNIYPYDYFAGRVSQNQGLAKVATLIAQERAANPNTLLIDAGDIIQGTPLGTYFATIDRTVPNPMAVVQKALGYDAVVLGNHEYDFGLNVLDKYIREVSVPVLAANIRRTDGSQAYGTYIIKSVGGVKVGILGLTVPRIDTWARAENRAGLRFDEIVDVAKEFVPRMRREGADLVVVALHSGPDRQPPGRSATNPTPTDEAWLTNPATWFDRGNLPKENQAIQLAEQVPGIDVILTGHTHQPIPKMLINGVLITQANRFGSHLGRVSVEMVAAGRGYRVGSKDAKLLPVNEVAADPEILALAESYHNKTLSFLSTPIGTLAAPFPGGDRARYVDSPLTDLINTVQKEAAAANGFPVDLSLAAVFGNAEAGLPNRQVLLRDAYSIYQFDNTLYVMEITGQILRSALETNAEYFIQVNPGAIAPDNPKAIVAPNARDFNWDIYSDIDYTIDLTRPVGQRVTRLQFKGQNISPDQKLRIAVNNYRGSGSGSAGYAVFRQGKILWASPDGVRDFIERYIKANPGLDPDKINQCNFQLVPDLFKIYYPNETSKCSR